MTACPECRTARTAGMSRRGFLSLLGGAGLGVAASPLLATQVGWAEPGYTGDVLVVLSFRGGFDGLSAVPPIGDPGYEGMRPTIAVPAARSIPLDATFGLNVALAGLQPLWDAGNLAVVTGAGMPSPNRSHFSAMDEIERAAPGSAVRTGWLDRVLGSWSQNGAFDGVHIGSGGMPMAYSGPFDELGFHRVEDFSLSGAWNAAERDKWVSALTALHQQAAPHVKSPATTTLGALTTAASLGDYTPQATYPDTELGGAFRDAAQIIKAGIGVRVVTIDEGDWDMHEGLGRPEQGGWMFDKLQEVGDSIAAFFADLGDTLTDEVTLVTLSEFGRRVDENDSQGVDHGWGNVMFVAGGNVNGGEVHGTWLGLNEQGMHDGDVRVTTDYRAVLADVLANRCDAGESVLQSVFPGFTGAHLGVTTA